MLDDFPEDFERRVREELVPLISDSAISVSLYPEGGKIDLKYVVELGISILLDKPIIVAVSPGSKIPENLVRVAEAIVELGDDREDDSRRIADAIRAVRGRTFRNEDTND